MIVFVKRELQKRGFYSRDFAGLPSDMSEGSREMLLALGWLLCKENIFSKFMQSCTSPLEEDDCLEMQEVKVRHIFKDCSFLFHLSRSLWQRNRVTTSTLRGSCRLMSQSRARCDFYALVLTSHFSMLVLDRVKLLVTWCSLTMLSGAFSCYSMYKLQCNYKYNKSLPVSSTKLSSRGLALEHQSLKPVSVC